MNKKQIMTKKLMRVLSAVEPGNTRIRALVINWQNCMYENVILYTRILHINYRKKRSFPCKYCT